MTHGNGHPSGRWYNPILHPSIIPSSNPHHGCDRGRNTGQTELASIVRAPSTSVSKHNCQLGAPRLRQLSRNRICIWDPAHLLSIELIFPRATILSST